ncbi:MAG: MFS transporter [Frankiales bacterium]|nr:MFS transporter [Frankiales bacterium]
MTGQLTDRAVPRAGRQREHSSDGVILALVCLAQFMVVLDVSIVNVALPSIGRELHYSATGLQWVVNAYVLTFAGFLLLGGRAADLFGRRRVFIVGLALFSIASLLGGFAQSSWQLTAARAAQGLGGAVLSPATLTIIMTTFTDGRSRHRAIGMWSAVAGAGGASGAILGGVLTSGLSWRWVLFVNVPIGAIAIVAAWTFLTETRSLDSDRSLDVAGAVTATAGLGSLVYGIVGTDSYGWGSSHTLIPIAISVVLLAVFFYIQARVAARPLMPLSLFKSRSLSVANAVMMLIGVVFFSMWYFLTLYLQYVHGYSPLKAGLLFFPMGLTIIVGAQIAARIVTDLGPRRVLAIGLALAAVGFLLLAQLDATSSYVRGVLPGSLLITMGAGLSFTPVAAAATSGVAPQLAGLASGVLNTSRQVGGSIGLAALATLATARTNDVLGGRRLVGAVGSAARTSGYDRAFLVAAAVVVVALLGTALLPRHVRPPVG